MRVVPPHLPPLRGPRAGQGLQNYTRRMGVVEEGGGSHPQTPPPDDKMTMTKFGRPIVAKFHHF